MSAALQTRGLVKRFGAFVATDNISLTVEQGARHALIGPNGAGKTTLVNLLTGMLMPDEGSVILEGQDVTRASPRARVRRGLARTFQINQLFPDLTPLQATALAIAGREGITMQAWRRLDAMQKDVIEVALLARRLDLPIDELMEVSAIIDHLSKRTADSA